MKAAWAGVAAGLAMMASVALADQAAFDLQGHRGARGLAPENSLAGFAEALSIGVTTLELDVGISRDGVVMVSHNRRLSPDITRDASGEWLRGDGPVLWSLSRAELETFDIGRINPASRYARKYPDQTSRDGSRMPTLGEVFALAERAGNGDVRFNIETKTSPLEADLTLLPEAFVEAVLTVIRRAGMAERVTIQSFDWRTLRQVQIQAPGMVTAYLTAQQGWLDNIRTGEAGPSPWTAGLDIDDHGGNVAALVAAAGGAVWAPYHREVDRAGVVDAHARGLAVKVWTVNDEVCMNQLIDLGVDGIITDYPDRLRRVMASRNMRLPPSTPVSP
ncbi:MAG: glycerophosphodiester phosphodiesterase [Alphaproteobacteria bacterium]